MFRNVPKPNQGFWEYLPVSLELLIGLKAITVKALNEVQQLLVKSHLDFYLICIQIHWGCLLFRNSSWERALSLAGVLVADCLSGGFVSSLSLPHQGISGENSHWCQQLWDAAGGNKTCRFHGAGPFFTNPLLWNDWIHYLWEFVKGFLTVWIVFRRAIEIDLEISEGTTPAESHQLPDLSMIALFHR